VHEAPGCLPQRSDHVEPPHGERPGEGDGLERLCWEVCLPSVELATLADSHDVLGISDRSGPVKTLSKHAADDDSGGRMVAACPRVDVL
jgi:hypothetical protein